MSASYVFQLVAFPPLLFRESEDGSTATIDVEPPPGCVMLDWKLESGEIFIRWRRSPEPGDVTAPSTDEGSSP